MIAEPDINDGRTEVYRIEEISPRIINLNSINVIDRVREELVNELVRRYPCADLKGIVYYPI